MGGGAEKNEAEALAQPAKKRQVTLEELSKHRTPSDAWMTMKGTSCTYCDAAFTLRPRNMYAVCACAECAQFSASTVYSRFCFSSLSLLSLKHYINTTNTHFKI